MTECGCRKGARCHPCIEADGLTKAARCAWCGEPGVDPAFTGADGESVCDDCRDAA